MDPAKLALLFGGQPLHADPDDPDDRAELLSADLDLDLDEPGAAMQAAVRAVIGNQIADDDPPEVWLTAQRLLAAGHDRGDVLRQLALAFTPSLLSALHDDEPFDPQAYVTALASLPLPSAEALGQAMVDVVRERVRLPLEAFDALVAARFGLQSSDAVVEGLLERVSQHVIDVDGPLELLAGDTVVHVSTLTADIVLTHELSPRERATDVLELGVDLAGLRRRRTLTLAGGDRVTVGEDGWAGPAGWLADLPAPAVAVHVRGDVVTLSPLEAAPAVDADLVTLLRAGYDEAVAEPWLPVPAEELVLHVLLAQPTAFAAPTAPLSHVLVAAGLEVRGTEVAHEESVWRNVERVQKVHRLMERVGDRDLLHAVVHVLSLVQDGPLDDVASARQVLDELADPAVLEVVADELLGRDDDPALLAEFGALSARLTAAASRPSQRAVAHWLAAVAAEREGRPSDAESSLRAAVRSDGTWPPAVDRLAWYSSDRGDAVTALALWKGLGADAVLEHDVRLLTSFVAPAGREPGRNEPCWCGSGRKYKKCHLGRAALPPLPERVGWLCRKAAMYLQRRGGAPGDVVYEHALARALEPDDDALQAALADPLVLDTVLHEGGWFDRFLAERGELLPDDEALLARAWTLVERTVYELLEVRPGEGVRVRDLRTGDVLDVRERTFSTVASPRSLVCARAVPDGASHQFVGGIFSVPPGRERDLLDLLDERDGLALLAYVAALERPPTIVGPDGEPIDLADLADLADLIGPADAVPLSEPQAQQAMLTFLQEREEQWCEEPVPALGGATPAEAATDPTRRDELVRLIDSFPEVDPSTGVFALRPERLRVRLGLPG